MKKKLPKEILVYVCETMDDGTPLYAVARNAQEIPEDADGQKVGIYILHHDAAFRVRRELK